MDSNHEATVKATLGWWACLLSFLDFPFLLEVKHPQGRFQGPPWLTSWLRGCNQGTPWLVSRLRFIPQFSSLVCHEGLLGSFPFFTLGNNVTQFLHSNFIKVALAVGQSGALELGQENTQGKQERSGSNLANLCCIVLQGLFADLTSWMAKQIQSLSKVAKRIQPIQLPRSCIFILPAYHASATRKEHFLCPRLVHPNSCSIAVCDALDHGIPGGSVPSCSLICSPCQFLVLSSVPACTLEQAVADDTCVTLLCIGLLRVARMQSQDGSVESQKGGELQAAAAFGHLAVCQHSHLSPVPLLRAALKLLKMALVYLCCVPVLRGASAESQEGAALQSAAASGHLAVCQYLLAAGADAWAHDSAALCGAVEAGHASVVELLLEAGADAGRAYANARLHGGIQGGHAGGAGRCSCACWGVGHWRWPEQGLDQAAKRPPGCPSSSSLLHQRCCHVATALGRARGPLFLAHGQIQVDKCTF
eukprot:464897-Pelagomonas_calceolata.AAC.4